MAAGGRSEEEVVEETRLLFQTYQHKDIRGWASRCCRMIAEAEVEALYHYAIEVPLPYVAKGCLYCVSRCRVPLSALSELIAQAVFGYMR